VPKNTVTFIDDRGTNDSPQFQLSNMLNVEDPRNGNFVVTLTRYGGNPDGTYEYVIEVE
jgi:hypothetical protein